MKKSVKRFLRAFIISFIFCFCIIFGFLGIIKAYENIRLIGFGEHRSFIEVEEDKIKIFDFNFSR